MTTHLIIDDERTLTPDGTVTHARSSTDALASLDGGATFDVIWFDHDLGGDDTTRPIANRLEEAAVFGQPRPCRRVFIHTANPVGRDWLSAALRHYQPTIVDAADWLT